MTSAPLTKKPKPSFQIDDVSLHPQIVQKLKDAKLYTFKSILHLSASELQKIAKVTSAEVKSIVEVVSKALITNPTVSACTLLSPESKYTKHPFSTDLFRNPIYTSSITEICGESGSGKTQVCLYLSIHAQKPVDMGGLNTKVIYIHTEGEFPVKRFLQMAHSFQNFEPNLQHITLTDNLILKKVFNLQEMMHVLQKGIPDMMKKHNSPKMIIIDSVAALLRCEYESLSARTSMMQQFAIEIWRLAHFKEMAVICVNQVSGSNSLSKSGNVTSDIPSLGLLWANILTSRLRLCRIPSKNNPSRRTLEIVYSSYQPCISTDFLISEAGIRVC